MLLWSIKPKMPIWINAAPASSREVQLAMVKAEPNLARCRFDQDLETEPCR